MMDLEKIKKQLEVNKESTDSTTGEVSRLTALMKARFLQQDRERLDDLERMREGQKPGPATSAPTATVAKGDGFNFSDLLKRFLLPSIPALTAIVASIAGFDDFLKGLNLVPKIDTVKNFFTRIGNLFNKIGRIALPDLPKIVLPEIPSLRIVDAAGEIVDNIKLKLPKLPKFSLLTFLGDVYNAGEPIKLKLPELPKFSFASFLGDVYNAGEPIKLKLPELPKFSFDTDLLKSFKIKLPELPNINILPENFSFIDKLKGILGNFPDGATDVAGKGILGFIGSAAKVLEPVLKPIKFIMRTVLRPFTQVLLSVIDFVVGFYKGFTGEDGELSEKLLAGLEGGFLGVVKGITEGFDLIFLELPAMLAEKLGAGKAAEFLRGLKITDLVDPIWAGIKGLVVFVGDQFLNMKDIIVGSFTIQLTRIVNGVKKAFTQLSTFINNLGDELYLLIAKNFRFKLPEVKIPETFLTPEFTLIPPINVGIGDAKSIAAAEERIDSRSTKAANKITQLDNEVAELMKAQQARLAELQESFQNNVINSINNSTNTTNNTNATVLNNNSMPSTVDGAQPI